MEMNVSVRNVLPTQTLRPTFSPQNSHFKAHTVHTYKPSAGRETGGSLFRPADPAEPLSFKGEPVSKNMVES